MSDEKKKILSSLITLSIPTILEEVLRTLLQYVDTAMVGHLGQRATAAVSTTTTINWLVYSLPYAVEIGIMALAAKSYGAKDFKQVKRITSQGLYLSLITGGVLTALCLFLSPFIPIWMGAETAIQRDASVYFFIISIPLVLRMMNAVFGGLIRATKDTKTPMIINLLANILNALLNAFFIYGLNLGVTGAAIASLIAYSLSGVAMIYLAVRRGWLCLWDKDLMRWDSGIVSETMRISVPAIGTSVASCLGYVFFAGMVSGMGTETFAAHSIAVTAEELFYMPGYGLRVATSSLVGNALGEGDRRKQDLTERISIRMTVIGMFMSGLILFLVSTPLMHLFTIDAGVAELGAGMLRMIAFTEPLFGLMVVIEGIFYGQGKTKGVFIVETCSMWGIRILPTWFVTHVFGLSLREVWYCMIADNVCKAVLLLVIYLYGRRREKHT